MSSRLMSSIRELPAANSAHGIRCLNSLFVGFPCGSRSKVILVMSNSILIAKQTVVRFVGMAQMVQSDNCPLYSRLKHHPPVIAKDAADKGYTFWPLVVVNGGSRRLSGNRFSTNLSQPFCGIVHRLGQTSAAPSRQREAR